MKVTIHSRSDRYEFDADGSKPLLFAGLGDGIALPYACASGTCGSCKATLKSGSVGDAWPAAPGKKGFKSDSQILLCQCAPRGDCEVEVAESVYRMIPGSTLPSGVNARVANWRLLTHDVASWELELHDPMTYEAGQFVLVRFPGVEGQRAYSMVNFEPGSRRLELLIKKKPDGGLSEALFAANPAGTQVRVTGPLGAAVFKPDAGKDVLCIAGGSGVAGMFSILDHAESIGYFEKNSGHLYFGLRSMRDAFFLDRLTSVARYALGALEITVCLSEEAVPDGAAQQYPGLFFAHGFVHEVALKQMTGRLANVHAFLAGPPPAVDAAMRGLILQGKLSPKNISFDKFS
ncbi:toluene monooxygenase electron transfer component [Variovorax paradoxus]|uniref:Toluene monooxygenase electron transfer component n=1 Tax=Variovorax paradoxus TaxID=34073 RepID=A0AAW8E888_VARPD|nr:2Fe-2S iron-sulfur cluster binding domain-containing protein [Variovorax paradoxus]MDP9968982.1 toluene monooxygenase electron transfer component [Variovorax paradoxus]